MFNDFHVVSPYGKADMDNKKKKGLGSESSFTQSHTLLFSTANCHVHVILILTHTWDTGFMLVTVIPPYLSN